MLYFSLFSSFQMSADHELMEMNFRKIKEVFSHNRITHKKNHNFPNKCNSLKDLNWSLRPIFHGLKYLIIYCFSHKCLAHLPINWRRFFFKKRGFCSSWNHLKKSLSVFAQVSRIERYGGTFERQFFRNLPNFPKIWFAIFG